MMVATAKFWSNFQVFNCILIISENNSKNIVSSRQEEEEEEEEEEKEEYKGIQRNTKNRASALLGLTTQPVCLCYHYRVKGKRTLTLKEGRQENMYSERGNQNSDGKFWKRNVTI